MWARTRRKKNKQQDERNQNPVLGFSERDTHAGAQLTYNKDDEGRRRRGTQSAKNRKLKASGKGLTKKGCLYIIEEEEKERAHKERDARWAVSGVDKKKETASDAVAAALLPLPLRDKTKRERDGGRGVGIKKARRLK